ncbi:MAG: ribokinase [Deltaproteobacteria bacterium]|nr:ribokinase [Deltaproteobacteria bacterium]
MVTSSTKLTIVGSVNFDIVAQVDRFPKEGENLPASQLSTFSGGKGANRAVAAARLGAAASLIGAVGNDPFGKIIADGLKNSGVDLKAFKIDPERPTGCAFITVFPSGNNAIIAGRGANDGLSPADIEKAADVIASSDAVVVDLEIPFGTVETVLRLARNKMRLSILDAGPAKSCPLEILRLADIVSPNESELEMLSGISVTDLESAYKAGKKLLARGVKELVLKLGARGAVWMTLEKQQHFPAVKVVAIDPTAAGDAFTTAFAIKFVQTKNMETAIEYANIAGALTTTRMGAIASLPTSEEVEKFKSQRG